jgi:hypothetical protein
MSLHALTNSRTPIEAAQRTAQHLRVWLAATGRSYESETRELFARAHPAIFGCAYDVALRGYDRWRARSRLGDSVQSFAEYIGRRHHRWITSYGDTPAMAPCLLGTPTVQPCWTGSDRRAELAHDDLRLAA